MYIKNFLYIKIFICKKFYVYKKIFNKNFYIKKYYDKKKDIFFKKMYIMLSKHDIPTRVPNEIFIKVQTGVYKLMFLVCMYVYNMCQIKVPRKRE